MKTKLLENGITVALAQMPVVAGNPRANADWMITEISKAISRSVDIIVFPELAVPGYVIGDMPEDESFVRDVWGQNWRVRNATAATSIVVIFGSYGVFSDPSTVGEDGRIRKVNAGFVVQNGAFLEDANNACAYFGKTLMPKYRMFDDERHYYSMAKRATEIAKPLKNILSPFSVTIRGQLLRIGCMICEDMWDQDYAQKPGEILAMHGIDLMINISCSPWGWQKNRARHKNVKRLSERTKVPFIYVNNTGVQNNGKNFLVFDGATTVYNEHGVVAHYLEPYFEGVQDVVVKANMLGVGYHEEDDVTQLYRGIEHGLRGYFRTIPVSMHKVVIGLSGGVDSAVVAALMVHILGKENVIGINMPYGNYNSEETRDNARRTAELLGVEYRVAPIDDIVHAAAALSDVAAGTSTFKTIQADARMLVLQTHASKIGGIFTCNGNKTEIAFGYYTLNGDGRGSVAPLGDLLKGEVYQLAHYLNTVVYKKEVIPRAVMDVEPMDELGPQGGVRKDPFDYGHVEKDGTFVRGYHDAMVQAFVGWRLNPEWFIEHFMKGDLEEKLLLNPGTLKRLFMYPYQFEEDLKRCWNLFHHATWKRVQSVPNILVSKRAFGWDYRESVLAPYYTDGYITKNHNLQFESLKIDDRY